MSFFMFICSHTKLFTQTFQSIQITVFLLGFQKEINKFSSKFGCSRKLSDLIMMLKKVMKARIANIYVKSEEQSNHQVAIAIKTKEAKIR